MNDRIDYDRIAESFAENRSASQQVIDQIFGQLGTRVCRSLLEIGCGTGDHLYVLSKAIACWAAGFDRSIGMIRQSKKKNPGLDLALGDASNGFPFKPEEFDLAFSVNVIHYIADLGLFFRENHCVLQPGGLVLTVTDSEEDIRSRSMCRYFPEIVEIELRRYPSIPDILTSMKHAGFSECWVGHARQDFRMDWGHFEKFKNKAYSSLRLISEGNYRAGMIRLEKDIQDGNAMGNELYTYVWGR